MKAFLYKIECITNLHVGSGDVNYSVVDNEVEKDPVLGCPIIHSSGVKGALRDFFVDQKMNKENLSKEEAQKVAKAVFGDGAKKDAPAIATASTVKFLDACLLSRPLRAKDGPSSFIQTTTVDIINHFLRQVKAFNCLPKGLEMPDEIGSLPFDIKPFLTAVALPAFSPENSSTKYVEDEETGFLQETISCYKTLQVLLGSDFAIAKSLDDYPLPVVARNKLENKISKTLWYEEYVPHDSVFFLIVLAQKEEDLDWLAKEKNKPCIVQFGGNASVGCGYTKLTRWGGFKNE